MNNLHLNSWQIQPLPGKTGRNWVSRRRFIQIAGLAHSRWTYCAGLGAGRLEFITQNSTFLQQLQRVHRPAGSGDGYYYLSTIHNHLEMQRYKLFILQ